MARPGAKLAAIPRQTGFGYLLPLFNKSASVCRRGKAKRSVEPSRAASEGRTCELPGGLRPLATLVGPSGRRVRPACALRAGLRTGCGACDGAEVIEEASMDCLLACHGDALTITYGRAVSPAAMSVRVCRSVFCRVRAVATTLSPAGALAIQATDPPLPDDRH